jgi:hypothetical protein
MRRIGLAVVLSLALFVVPLDGGAQQAARIARIGYLAPAVDPNSTGFLSGGWPSQVFTACDYGSLPLRSADAPRHRAAPLVGFTFSGIGGSLLRETP